MAYIWIIAVTYFFAFLAGFAVMAWKVRGAAIQAKVNGATLGQVRGYYQSALPAVAWMCFKAALIAGTVIAPLSVLVFRLRFLS